MAKYRQGSIHITLFDRYGSKIRTLVCESDSYIDCQVIAEDTLAADEEVFSYQISRVLYSSLEQNNGARWLKPQIT